MTFEQELLPLTPETPPDLTQRTMKPSDLVVRQNPRPDAALRHSVATWGVLKPVLVQIVSETQVGEQQYDPVTRETSISATIGPARFVVVDGNRRTLAALQAIEDDLLVSDYEIPVVATSDLGYLQNVVRVMLNATQDRNPIAEMEAIDELLRNGYSESQIATETGMSVGTIRQRLRYLVLIPEVRREMDAGRIKTSVAKAMTKLSAEEQRAVIDAARKDDGELNRITMDDVKRIRTAVVQAATMSLPGNLFSTPDLPEEDDEPVPTGKAIELRDNNTPLPGEDPSYDEEELMRRIRSLAAWMASRNFRVKDVQKRLSDVLKSERLETSDGG